MQKHKRLITNWPYLLPAARLALASGSARATSFLITNHGFFLLFTMFLIKFLKNIDIQKTETKIWLFNVLHLFGMPLFEHVFCLTPINNFVIYKPKKVNTKKQTIQRIRLNLHLHLNTTFSWSWKHTGV